MSILNTDPTAVLTPAQRQAKLSRQQAKQLADQLIRMWHIGWDTIWSSEDPGAILAELGPDAGELFELNEAMIAFLASTLAGKRQEELDAILAKVAAKPATITAEDGSVTIDPAGSE